MGMAKGRGREKMECVYGKLRSRDGEKWCGNIYFLSCSPHATSVCLPRLSGVRKGADFHGMGQQGLLYLVCQYQSCLPITRLTDHLVPIQHFVCVCVFFLFKNFYYFYFLFFTGSQFVSQDLWKYKYLPFQLYRFIYPKCQTARLTTYSPVEVGSGGDCFIRSEGGPGMCCSSFPR